MPGNRDTSKHWRDYLLLGLFVFLAYLPLSSFLFALKNDALTANFPQKYFFSAALRSGHLPLWNPYMNFGLPLYADPGFAFWNPFTWVFGGFGYTVGLLSLEVLVFIYIGAIAIYRLSHTLGHSRLTGLLLGFMYSGCGFFIGNLTHINFLTGAAFLPLAVSGFLRLQSDPTPKRFLSASLAIYFVTAGGHPAIPFASCYFFLLIAVGWITTGPRPLRNSLPRFLRTNALLLLTSLILASPILLSWLEILPHITRSTPAYQPNEVIVGFSIPAFLSFLMPVAATAYSPNFLALQTMRDAYFSLPGIVLLVYALFTGKNRLQRIFLLAGLGMLLLSLGGPLKGILYSHLPPLNYITNNGEFRVFAILSFLIVLSWPLDRLLTGGMPLSTLAPILNGLMIIGSFAALLALFLSWNYPPPPTHLRFVDQIKYWLDNIPFGPRLFFNSLMLLALLSLWRLASRHLKPGLILPVILTADLILSCWVVLPITGVQRRSPAVVQALLDSAPRGIPRPALIPLEVFHPPTPDFDSILGHWQYYSKQPGTPWQCGYPTLLINTYAYYNSPLSTDINLRPFLFLTRKDKQPLLRTFSPTRIDATVAANAPAATTPAANATDTASPAAPDTLILLQNDYPGWETTVDDIPRPHTTPYLSFIGVPLPADGRSHQVSYRFRPYWITGYWLIALGGALTLIFLIWKKSPPTRAARDRMENKDDPDSNNTSASRR